MHAHNRYDGADEVLALFCNGGGGVAQPNRSFPGLIPGHLQHRLHPVCFEPSGSLPTSLVWSEPARERLPRHLRRRAIVVGAPWLYLLSMPEAELAVPLWLTRDERLQVRRMEIDLQRSGGDVVTPVVPVGPPALPDTVLTFPVHGLGGLRHAARVAEGCDAPLPHTVVLSDSDFAIPEIRDAYASRGANVTHLGARVRPLGETGPGRLEKLRDLMVGASRVQSNVPHWTLLYAAAAGTAVRIFGPAPLNPPTGPIIEDMRASVDDQAALQQLADYEMGADLLLSPQELGALFNWRTK